LQSWLGRALGWLARRGQTEARRRARPTGVLAPTPRPRGHVRAHRDPDPKPAKRAEKEEIARWFAIWLQTPDLFSDWLALRKQRL
jgi:hypothetical protein